MRAEDSATVERVRAARPWVAAVETLLLAIVVPVLGGWLNPADPFLVKGPVSWPLLAPMLAGLRHGFMAGFGCASTIAAFLIFSWRYPLVPVPLFPGQLIAGLVFSGMLAGQFAHVWASRNRRMAALSAYQGRRFDEFARNYQLLKVSHDTLEEASASAMGNLRNALSTLRTELLRAPDADTALRGRAPLLLELFQAFAHVQAAALLPVAAGRLQPPCASLGAVPDSVAADPLVELALRSKRVASLPSLQAPGGPGMATTLVAAVPLVDVEDRVWAVLAIKEMPFFALTAEMLRLHALLAGAMADTLSFGAMVKGVDAQAIRRFEGRVRRCLRDVRENQIPASLLVFAAKEASFGSQVLPHVLEERRGLDEGCQVPEEAGSVRLFVLLPLTDERGLQGYLKRLDQTLRKKLHVSLAEAGVQVLHAVELGRPAGEEALQALHAATQRKIA